MGKEDDVPDTPSKVLKTHDLKFQCLDCGHVDTIDGVEVFKNGNITKYVCKECRGRCLPQDYLKKTSGVKSIDQNFQSSKIGAYLIIGILCLIGFNYYQKRVTMIDYKNYLTETAIVRKKINAHLDNFKKDFITINDKKSTASQKELAQKRLKETKNYIVLIGKDSSKFDKPAKEEIFQLYDLETKFWRNPSFENYNKYSTVFNDLKKRYDSDLFEYIKSTVRERMEKSYKLKHNKAKSANQA